MLTRIKSTISTVTSTLQAVRELPGAMKEVVEFVRRNGDNIEVNRAYQLVKNLAAALEIDMDIDDERNKLSAEVKLLNDTLFDLQTEYSKELVAHKETERETEDLRTKLARYEAAEKWHQVTAGEGELPPAIPVLWRNNHPDFQMGELNYSIKGACGYYEWRFLSSGDVPC